MGITVETIVPAERDRVWRYFAAPGAFQRLSPPFLPLRPSEEATSLRGGTARLALSSSLPGVLGRPVGPRWVARHDPTGYVEGAEFVDRCDSAPYRQLTGWTHHHSFGDVTGPRGQRWTTVRDEVRARMPRSVLARAFAYRHRQLAGDLAAADRLAELGLDGPLTVAVTGASGLVGTQLCALLSTAGHRVIKLVRGAADGPDERHWDVSYPVADLLDGVDVLVHLAGEPIAARFTAEHVSALHDSRVGPTRALAELVAERGGATAMICASAVGYYGADRGDETLSEDAEAGSGVLAEVVTAWEQACRPAVEAGVRVVNMRTGIVLSAAGGVLGALAPLFSAGLGGRLGSGRQWMSWIAVDDLVDLYHRAVVDGGLSGPINAVAPEAVRNTDFTRTLARTVRRPALLPVPAAGPAALLGRDGARELALADQRVVPSRLLGLDHRFRYPGLPEALAHELGRETVPDRYEFIDSAG